MNECKLQRITYSQLSEIQKAICMITKPKSLKKLTHNDLFKVTVSEKQNGIYADEKVASYRMQEEYGPKKFIKP